MPFIPLADRLADKTNELSLVLCGPILRRVEKDAVTVWVALKEEKKVWLEVYENIAGDLERPNLKKILAGERKTIAVGKFLHIVAVTAIPVAATQLQQGKIYFYNLFFTDPNATTVSASATNLESPKMTFFEIHYAHEPEDLGDHNMHIHLPSFCVPPDDFRKLRIVHGSCRKAHAEGLDAMPAIDSMILADRFSPDKRPHYLFLTGDQFYADDVSRIMLYLLMDAESSLFNGVELLPDPNGKADPDDPDKFIVPVLPDDQGKNAVFFAGDREDVGCFTSHEPNGLATAGEYMSYYLFMWSDIPWMNMGDFPDFTTIGGKRREYDADLASLTKFRDDLSRVKRAMANVPTYMIFDDHDVTDDWYMTYEWCKNVLTNELGRRMVLNGLLSYAFFQDWGNKPEDYTGTNSGKLLLDCAEKWFAKDSKRAKLDATSNEEPDLQKLVGIPVIPVGKKIPEIFVKENDYFVLKQDAAAIKWFFKISRGNYEIIFLDGRTRRGYPDPDIYDKASHPDIISRNSVTDQIGTDEIPPKEITILIAPTPIISIPAIELNELPALARSKANKAFEKDRYKFDFFDHWKNQTKASENLLTVLSKRNCSLIDTPPFKKQSRLVVLTGDVHFAAVSRMQYEFPEHKSLFTQLVSSSFKKQTHETRVLHQLGYKFGNISGAITGQLLMGIWGKDMWNWIRDIDNTLLRILFYGFGAVGFIVLFALHMIVVVISGLMLVADALFFQDFFNEKGIDSRHILGWADPAAKEGITKLRIPIVTPEGPKFEEIELTKPYAVNIEVLNEVEGPNIKFPDWQYRIDFILAANDVRAPASDPDTIPPLVDAPSPGDRKRALSQYLALASNHLSYAQKHGNGKEIVGVNNISEVFFDWSDTEESVRQESWWRLQGKEDGQMLPLFPLSKFKVSLKFDDPEFKIPPFSTQPN